MTHDCKYGPWPHEDSPEWRRMAKQAIAESRAALDVIPPHMRDVGNPNSPINSGLFGMETSAFMAMQYKESE